MEKSLLYELAMQKLKDYRDKFNKDRSDNFTDSVKKSRKALEAALTPEQLNLVGHYKFDLELDMEYVDFNLSIKLFNYGVRIGMQLQKAFDEFDAEE